jgi:hypothetical protein
VLCYSLFLSMYTVLELQLQVLMFACNFGSCLLVVEFALFGSSLTTQAINCADERCEKRFLCCVSLRLSIYYCVVRRVFADERCEKRVFMLCYIMYAISCSSGYHGIVNRVLSAARATRHVMLRYTPAFATAMHVYCKSDIVAYKRSCISLSCC